MDYVDLYIYHIWDYQTAIAKRLIQITGGDLYEIVPEEMYTSSDLNWHNPQSHCSKEMNDLQSRLGIKEKRNIAEYDTIFLGYPIWWNMAPRIVNTFIEGYKLKGKIVSFFATSGRSSIDQ